MTVPYRAVQRGRRGYGIELNHQYFLDGAAYCQAAEHERNVPSLFDLIAGAEEEIEIDPEILEAAA